MNFAVDYIYRLAPRGGAGLACDETGVALGATDLARVHLDAGGRRWCEVRPPGEIGRVLKAAYGPQPDAVVQRLHRGLNRTARWLEAGDLCHAGVEAVMLGFPDLTPTAMAKLAELADLEKRGAPWEDEPRVPAGQAGGGQWTTGGGGGGAAARAKPLRTPPPPPSARPEQPIQPRDDWADRPTAAKPPTHLYTQQPQATLNDGVYYFGDGQGPGSQPTTLDDGVYRPSDRPRFIPTAAAQDEVDEEPYGSNGPPEDFPTLQEMFPGLKEHPFVTAVLGPLDHFVGFSALADEMNLSATTNMYHSLVAQIKAIDPHFVDYEIFPEGGIAGMSWEGRANLINYLRFERAAAYYNIRGQVGPLQVETLRFLRKTVDYYYVEAVRKFNAGQLKPQMSPEVAIGNYIDGETRGRLKEIFNQLNIEFGKSKNITVNNRDYDTSRSKKNYRVPDARIGNVAFDWTIGLKTADTNQVRDFFKADSKPVGVVIVRPSQVDSNGAYYIPRPVGLRKEVGQCFVRINPTSLAI
jgi:hypothetical protein